MRLELKIPAACGRRPAAGVRAILLCSVLLSGACAKTAGDPVDQAAVAAAPTPKPLRDRDVLGPADLEGARDASDLYEAIRRLRPHFLRTRGRVASSSGAEPQVVVYLGSNMLGGPTTLKNIRVDQVFEVRYLDASAATTRYGSGHTAGAIIVTMKSG